MPHIYRCHLTLMEPTFFSSREVSNFYQTEPLIGNFALAYAFEFCRSPYFNDGTIHYREHLGMLNEEGVYVTPATIQGDPQFTVGQFNAQPDTYWFAMGSGVLVTRPDDGWVEGEGKTWRVFRAEEDRGKKVSSANRPQFGRIRYLSIGNEAVCYVISEPEVRVPRYIRLGKFMSKARVQVEEVTYRDVEEAQVRVPFLLNPADLPAEIDLHVYDLVNVPPTPLVRNAVLSGQFHRVDRETYLPAGMRFGVEDLP